MTPQINRYRSWGFVLVPLLFALAGLLTPRTAGAVPGVARGTVMVSAERLFGLSLNRTTSDTGGGSSSVDHTGFSLFLSSPSTVHMLPRIAFDFAVTDGLTLGGAFGFSIGDRDTSTTNGNNTTDVEGPTSSALILAPRVGYALGLSHVLDLWLRGGVTYYRTNTESERTIAGALTTASNRSSGLSLDIEPTLIVKPFDHFGFTAGLLVNLPLAGTHTTQLTVGNTTTSNSNDETIRNFGIVAGMLGTF